MNARDKVKETLSLLKYKCSFDSLEEYEQNDIELALREIDAIIRNDVIGKSEHLLKRGNHVVSQARNELRIEQTKYWGG